MRVVPVLAVFSFITCPARRARLGHRAVEGRRAFPAGDFAGPRHANDPFGRRTNRSPGRAGSRSSRARIQRGCGGSSRGTLGARRSPRRSPTMKAAESSATTSIRRLVGAPGPGHQWSCRPRRVTCPRAAREPLGRSSEERASPETPRRPASTQGAAPEETCSAIRPWTSAPGASQARDARALRRVRRSRAGRVRPISATWARATTARATASTPARSCSGDPAVASSCSAVRRRPPRTPVAHRPRPERAATPAPRRAGYCPSGTQPECDPGTSRYCDDGSCYWGKQTCLGATARGDTARTRRGMPARRGATASATTRTAACRATSAVPTRWGETTAGAWATAGAWRRATRARRFASLRRSAGAACRPAARSTCRTTARGGNRPAASRRHPGARARGSRRPPRAARASPCSTRAAASRAGSAAERSTTRTPIR